MLSKRLYDSPGCVSKYLALVYFFPMAVIAAGEDFSSALGDLEKCDESSFERPQHESHDSSWIEDLENTFGKSYVVKNISAIRADILYLYAKNADVSRSKQKKAVFYRETVFTVLCREYLER